MNKIMKKAMAAAALLAITVTSMGAPTFAGESAPSIKKTEYEGKGKVQVEFRRDVRYRNTRVVVKDTAGNKYKAVIVDRDDDDIDFRIKGFKKGRTYRFTIKNVKNWNGSSYRNVKGKVRIPGAKKSKYIGRKKAENIALRNAGLTRGQVRWLWSEFDRDDGVPEYDVEFRRGYMEYEYEIHAVTGRIISKDVEWDD